MEKKTFKTLLFALLPLAVAALLTLSYFTDNKYFGGAPVEDGVVTISSESVCAITDGWSVYRGLLSPRAAADAEPSATGMKLGGEPNFSAFLGEPFGAVTYRTEIRGAGEISLYFPEVLSAYKIFIGEEELGGEGSVGGGYESRVKDRIYEIRLDGTVSLTVQVENRDAVYGGLYFPPLAGGRDAISDAVKLRLTLYTAVFAAIAALLVLTVPPLLFSRGTRKYFLPYGATCLFTAVSLIYPLFTAYGTSAVNVSYFVQNAASAAVLLSALILTARVGSFENRRHYRYAALPAAIGLTVAAPVFTLLTPVLGGMAYVSGFLISAWKTGLSLYLLAVSVRAFLKTRAPREALTLAAIFSYSLCLLFSVAAIGFFEPIRGFFPEELGAISTTFAFAALMISQAIRTTKENERLNESLAGEVAKKTAALTDLLEDRKRLIRNLTHDLKTPITAVRAYAELVSENETLDGEARRGLAVMVSRLNDFNDRVQLLERFNKGENPSETESVDLNEFLASYYEKTQDEAERNGAKFVLKLPGETLTVSCDRSKLERLIENLVFNAVSFTAPGDRIGIALSRDGGEAVIRVTDTGSGIAPDDLPRLFDLSFSVRKNAEDRGLGLYIAKLIVTEYLGTITAESEPNVKTTFTVRFPLCA